MKSFVSNSCVYDLPYVATPPSISEHVDLRSDPSKIDRIPELAKEPTLKALIQVMNNPRGKFMTHGCGIAATRPGCGDPSPTIPIPPSAESAGCWYSTYVNVSFWILEFNKGEHYHRLYEMYPFDKIDSNICFEMQPAYFCTPEEQTSGRKVAETNGAVCFIWVSGWGSSPKEARDSWHGSIQNLITFFTDPSAANSLVRFSKTGITLAQYMFEARF